MGTLALIPARAGSKGVTGKNVRPLAGRPLLEWTIAACRRAKRIDRVIVSTDSAEYGEAARKAGAEAPFLRPAEISGDASTDYEFVLHALNWLAARGEEPEYIAHMRPTTPLREPALIDEAICMFSSAKEATALRSVHEMSESAYKTFELGSDGRLSAVGGTTSLDAANAARQTFPKTFHANGYVDVLSTAFIRRARLLHGDGVLGFVTPPTIEVDSEDDFLLLEFQLTRRPHLLDLLFA